jgi:hypothetical protein
MRTKVPASFSMPFIGPEGPYRVRFDPTDEWDGVIDTSVGGLQMRWDVVNAEQEEAGGLVLGGMTTGSQSLWNDEFWFELRLDDNPPTIRYWGDKVIWREDRSI